MPMARWPRRLVWVKRRKWSDTKSVCATTLPILEATLSMDAQNSWPRVLKAHRLLLSVLLVIVTGAFTSEKWSLIPSQTHVIVPRSPLLADNNDRMRCHENFIFLFISGTTNYGTIKWIMWVNWLITQNGLSDRLFKFFYFFCLSF
jgi:hypothetical protein